MIRTVVIGMGGRGRVWAKALRDHPDYTLSAIVDPNVEVLQAAAAELVLPPAQCHATLADVIDTADASVVVTPHHIHYAVARELLLAGKHGLVEKPFTLDMPQARELVDLAAARDLTLSVGQNYRFKSVCRYVAEAIQAQRLGRLNCVTGSFYRHRPPRQSYEVDMPWPLLFTQSIHHLDWLLSVLPAKVQEVHGWHRCPPWSKWTHPSVCQVSLRCDDGALVTYAGSYAARGEQSSYNGQWRFECEQGDLILDDPEDTVWEVTGDNPERTEVFKADANAPNCEHLLLDQWRDGICDGIEPPTSGRRNLETLALLFELMRQ